MILESDITFSDEDLEKLKNSTNVGETYRIPRILFVIYDDNKKVEWSRNLPVKNSFLNLIVRTDTIECVSDDCSVVRFLDINKNELERLTTTSEFGSILSSKPQINVFYSLFVKK